jgi:hypothetical protein
MNTPFKLDPDVVSGYKTAQAVRSVMHRMGSFNNQADFTYHGKTSAAGITEHRIREIQALADLGTTYTDGPSYFQRHASEAISALDSHLEHWDLMTKHLGRENVFKRVEGFINRTRERILPACFAIHEADSDECASASYQEMCDRWMKHCGKNSQFYREEKMCSSRAQKNAIRQAEIAAAKVTLQAFRDELAAWVDEVQAQIQ